MTFATRKIAFLGRVRDVSKGRSVRGVVGSGVDAVRLAMLASDLGNIATQDERAAARKARTDKTSRFKFAIEQVRITAPQKEAQRLVDGLADEGE